MAPQDGERRKGQDERGPPPWVTDDDYPSTSVPEIIPSIVSTSESTSESTMVSSMPPFEFPSNTNGIGYSTLTEPETMAPPSGRPSSPPWMSLVSRPSFATSSSHTSTSTEEPYPDGIESPSSSSKLGPIATYRETSSPTTTDVLGGRLSGWGWSRKGVDHAPMYAAAAVVPVVVLAIIGIIAFVCLRKRKRRKSEAAASQKTAQEMKTQPPLAVQPYMAPDPLAIAILRQYTPPADQLPPTSTPSQIQPVILGPIGSGSDGAYLTGMDTSDMVSITSNTLRPVDPFADNNSLAEPPPPYRPHSIAPPSFTSMSRHSSVRTTAPHATSQTHLIERSPFDDPDEDAVSELSGPTVGRNDDVMSAVSDLSYQHDPFAGKPLS